MQLRFQETTAFLRRALAFCISMLAATAVFAADQPQWGQAWSRNMVSAETNLPDSFDPATGKNIKWVAKLGTETHSSPVVAGGRIYIGTNNGEPRDPKHEGDRGVLMCLEEATGKLLWQLVVPKRDEDQYLDWPRMGICSPATVESNRVYITSNRGEVMCLDVNGLADGNDGPFQDEGRHMTPHCTNADVKVLTPGAVDADILWLFDLTSGAGIWSHDSAHSSILIDGEFLYLNSGTGVDNTHKVIRTPNAPSLVVLEKKTGRLVGRDDEHIAPKIFHGTWSSVSMATVAGKKLVFLAGGDGVVYAFEALKEMPETGQVATLKRVWRFDFDPAAPKENVRTFQMNRTESPSNFYGMPVFYRDRIYIAGGGDVFWGKNAAWVKCFDGTKTGDVTTNALIWSYPLEKHVLATPVIANGLVFIADCGHSFHCADAETGKLCWTHEIKGEGWATALVADGKVYFGSRSGNYYVFAAERKKRVLSEFTLGAPISATAMAANGVLYIATAKQLYAVAFSSK